MSALAIQRAMERQRRGDNPRPRPQLRLVHDAERPVVRHEPVRRIGERVSIALNKAFAFCLIVTAIVSLSMLAYAAGSNDDIMRENRQRIAEIEVAPMPPPLQQIGTFNRERGR